MMTDACESYKHVNQADRQVQNKQQEVSSVFKTDTVVDPWAVVIEEEHTSVASTAVVGPGRLDFFASRAFLNRQIRHRFVAVPKQLLHFSRNAFESVLFYLLAI